VGRRHRHLFDRIADFANLLAAYRLARKAGRDKPGPAKFDYELEAELWRLRAELSGGRYRPGPYRSFHVHEPKRRLISAAPFRDRVVHHAVVRVIEPILERRFITDSYACRKGRGTHVAVDRAHAWVRRYRYCLRADIVRFFPSVDHEVLMRTVHRVIGCRRTLELLRVILGSGAHVLRDEFPRTLFFGDDLLALLRPRGLPIGNLTSQFLANVHLDPLDHFVKETLRVRAYVRYADDFRLFAESKQELHNHRRAMERFLARLRLALHERKSQVQPCAAGVPFLGFVLYVVVERPLGSVARRVDEDRAQLQGRVVCDPEPPIRGQLLPPGILEIAVHDREEPGDLLAAGAVLAQPAVIGPLLQGHVRPRQRTPWRPAAPSRRGGRAPSFSSRTPWLSGRAG
jgi:retron-type reverse transcriptase